LVVQRDGIPVDSAEWGLPIPVDPGTHPVAASAPNRQAWQTTVTVAANTPRSEVIVSLLVPTSSSSASTSPTANPGHPAPVADAPSAETSSVGIAGLAIGAAGLLGLGIGSYYGLLAKSTHDDALKYCDATNRCSPDGISKDDTAHSQATVSTISMLAGAALLTTGAAVFLVSRSASSGERSRPSVSLALSPTAHGGAMSVGGSF